MSGATSVKKIESQGEIIMPGHRHVCPAVYTHAWCMVNKVPGFECVCVPTITLLCVHPLTHRYKCDWEDMHIQIQASCKLVSGMNGYIRANMWIPTGVKPSRLNLDNKNNKVTKTDHADIICTEGFNEDR